MLCVCMCVCVCCVLACRHELEGDPSTLNRMLYTLKFIRDAVSARSVMRPAQPLACTHSGTPRAHACSARTTCASTLAAVQVSPRGAGMVVAVAHPPHESHACDDLPSDRVTSVSHHLTLDPRYVVRITPVHSCLLTCNGTKGYRAQQHHAPLCHCHTGVLWQYRLGLTHRKCLMGQ